MLYKNSLILLGFSLVAAYGCGIGDAPQGLSATETQAAVKALPPQQQIDYINRSPMPTAMKAQRIAEIKASSGLK